MYILKPGIKGNLVRQWALPDRIFFASGACHILAYAVLERYPAAGFVPLWIKPAKGFTGNHIVAVRGELAFDYHGWSSWRALLDHTRTKANRWWPGWAASVIELPAHVLVSEARSREIDGLWLREPGQFLHDAIPRARAFLDRHPVPAALASEVRRKS